MIKTMLTRGLLVLACGTTAFTAGTVMNGTAQASTAHATPAQKAYAAFVTWEHHPARGNLDGLVVASFALPAKYDQADIDQLAADVNGGAKTAGIARDKAYVDQDLTQLMLPMAS